ncbi:GEVED domain-containing protein [Winogradskyella schleiferi]|uniref:GEVED domain-containing protein n=1 Tax=Winogradskyella schleiferi TaxID=2686078 RepID=UPI0015BA7C7A|nr:GEVED domain-containing protein [Winogradskyella schleiferi]
MSYNLRFLFFTILFAIQINAQMPPAPINLLANNITATSVNLSWDAITDLNGSLTYNIYKDGIFLANTSETTYQAADLSSGTLYVFTVKVEDTSNTESSASNEVAVMTLINYCSSYSNVYNEEWIRNVQLNTINNYSSNLPYSDFSSLSTLLSKGTQYTISIIPVWSGIVYNEGYSVWIDYNNDGDFNDADEQVWTQSATRSGQVTGSFTVPVSSVSGKTKMRVSMKYNGIPSSCENFTYGEVEDYTVNLVGSNDLIYTGGNWITEEPSNSLYDKDIFILDGNINIDSDVRVNTIEVSEDASLTISKLGSLTVDANFITNGNVTLESDSNEFSSLIVNGYVIGEVTYKRHVNISSGGKDLIAAPVLGQPFNDFLAANSNIVSNGDNTLYLFGPFEKPTNEYITYSSTETAKLTASTGYRAASTDNDTFTFKGLVTTEAVSAPVFISGSTTPEWNLIGNPYPCYISLKEFLRLNNSKFNTARAGIYGYDGDASNGWTIWNQAYVDDNPEAKIAPGQGFLVATNTDGINFEFTPSMRVLGNTDDFIAGRQQTTSISHLQIKLSNTTNFYKTDFYFTDNATLGQDPNYDSEIIGASTSLAIYSHLVEDNLDKAIGVQSIGNTRLSDVVIPLGVTIESGQQATFNISETTLSADINVYLEDRMLNTSTLLNNMDYTFTSNVELNGTGRFYLRFSEESTLGIINNELANIKIYNKNASKIISVEGDLASNSRLSIYDLQGRLIKVESLKTNGSLQTINASYLSTGIYVVKLKTGLREKAQKIIIK